MSSSDESFLQDLVVDTAEDWSSVAWVYSLCLEAGATAEAGRRRALSVIHLGLVERMLLVAGELDEEEQFQAWSITPQDAFERVRAAWINLPGIVPPLYGFPWFDLTAKGEDEARLLLAAKRT